MAETDSHIGVVHIADSRDPGESLARFAAAAVAARAPIRLRVSVQIMDEETKQYLAWRGQVWKTEVKDAETAKVFQAALEEFFDLLLPAKEWPIVLQALKVLRGRLMGDEEKVDVSTHTATGN